MEYFVDARGKSIGRLASDVATKLMGKEEARFVRNVAPGNKVLVTNAAKLKISPQKLREKVYIRYSGYPGGQKAETLEEVITKKGYGEVVRRAVKGMLPDNKLKKDMLKGLEVTE